MNLNTQKNNNIALQVWAISFLAVLISFLWQGNKEFSLWDEGFLWYGVQRVLLGEVPIRDFMAYDPGRYYWSAALVGLFGNQGIIGVRAAAAVFQALGLAVGLFLVAQSTKNKSRSETIFWLLSSVTFLAWMFPRHKIFDISVSIFLVGVLTHLINKPIPKRYFIAGGCVGLAAVFGRNHGLYGAVGSLGVIAWIRIKHHPHPGFIKATAIWGVGVLLGFLPIILMALLVPGFAIAFWESVRFLLEQNATNLPLSVPWPWTINFAAMSVADAARSVLTGLLFMGTLVFGVLAIAAAEWQRARGKSVPPALVATAFLAFPYAHFAFSRADISHLAQGIFPLLIGCMVLLSQARGKIKWPLAVVLCAASVWLTFLYQPGWQCSTSKQCVTVEISGSELQVARGTANDIDLLRHLAAEYAPNGQTFIAAPLWPGAYALLQRKAPMWEIYALFPRSKAFEKSEIERIEASKPGFALIFDLPLDGRDDLRFKNTHPLINQYIQNHYHLLPKSGDPPYQIYTARSLSQ
ncbi:MULTISPECIES: hypothetical protein [unclassified Achromobacter]|uniref:hypothetical protein n=1 Tax=unclassified Achromobacter TaxID=2626865 RepID=UPI000B51CC1E|nr:MULTISPECIES: hypothetical protein [unclassified Achromobacter]OWT74972.1 hypothetical protein CEY04_20620 [Achromobacter sp. HZ28]OWT76580.1 hypothetical protein CEY05_16075 [Achromobacter sp. HZ34]